MTVLNVARCHGVLAVSSLDVPFVDMSWEEMVSATASDTPTKEFVWKMGRYFKRPTIARRTFDLLYLNFRPRKMTGVDVEEEVKARGWKLYPASPFLVAADIRRAKPSIGKFLEETPKGGIFPMERVVYDGRETVCGFGWSEKTPCELRPLAFDAKMLEDTWFAFTTTPWTPKD